ncbi:hypothetical protein [Chloroherpeton thalassium]|uniref:hypothetical protein n=1 Tax=Chloroherpeton thalassium TaxID=100716 RepID=UPI00145D1107|nr:hypothetical protein [Chloroherpeton thalassium]
MSSRINARANTQVRPYKTTGIVGADLRVMLNDSERVSEASIRDIVDSSARASE